MSAQPIEPLTIRLLDRDFQINCPPEEHEGLLNAARFLDLRLRDARDHGPSLSMEKLAIMTALNLSDGLLTAQADLKAREDNVDKRLATLTEQLSRQLDGAGH